MKVHGVLAAANGTIRVKFVVTEDEILAMSTKVDSKRNVL